MRALTPPRWLAALVALGLAACEPAPACRGPSDCRGGSDCVRGECRSRTLDRDGDGIPDALDRCPDWAPDPAYPLSDQIDSDGDGLGDPCDPCPEVYDPHERDADGDGLGQSCALPGALEQEPLNDSPLSAPELPLGRWVEGVIGPPAPEADWDWAFFRARAGQRLRLEARAWPSTSRMDPLLVVMDRATLGLAYLRLADDSPEGRDALLDLLLPVSGEYLVLVTEAHNWFFPSAPLGSAESRWRLRLSLHPEGAQELALPAPARRVARPAGRLTGFRLRPPGAGLVSITARGAGPWDPAVHLVAARSGRLLASQDNRADCPGSRDARLLACLTGEAVEVWVEAVGLPGLPAATPSDIRLEFAWSEACTGQGRLPAEGGAWLGALAGPDGGSLRVEVEAGGFAPELVAFGCPAGEGAPAVLARARPTAAWPGRAGLELWPAPRPGIFLEVRDALERGGCEALAGGERAFQVAAIVESPQAEPFPGGVRLLEPPPGRFVWFELQGTTSERLRVSARPLPGSTARPAVVLAPPSGEPLLARAAAPGAGSDAELAWAPARVGPLWLGIKDSLGCGGPGCALELELTRERLPDQVLLEPEGANDAPSEAAALPEGALVIHGALGLPAEDPRDCFSLTVPLGRRVELSTWLGEGAAPPADTRLELFDEAGRRLARSDEGDGSSLARLAPLAGRGLGWRVCVGGRGAGPLFYRLEVRNEPWPAGQAATPLPDELCVNEVLLEPGSADLNADGRADAGDQFLELVHAGPLALELQGLEIWAAGGGARFDGPFRLEPGGALLVFNGPLEPGLYPVPAFGLGRQQAWLAPGPGGLELGWSEPGGFRRELSRLALPGSAAPGESLTRPVDGDCGRALRPHAALPAAAGARSPGTRLDGRPFGG
jgi:hypothetical protein